MKRIWLCLCLYIIICVAAKSQQTGWHLGMNYFFDNTEYDKSSLVPSETMQAIWLKPEINVRWSENNSLHAGINVLKIPGTDNTINKTELTIYYRYKTENMRFMAGAYPREGTLDNYNTFFFKDSVRHFLPVMYGVFWEVGSQHNFLNAWLDWTGYASPTQREHFFLGVSGKATRSAFFADFQSYMFHYSVSSPMQAGQGVSENLQLQANVGIEGAIAPHLYGLASIGFLGGYERDRRYDNALWKPVGFVASAQLAYKRIGTNNLLYAGDPRMRLASQFGGDLYWGTPFLRNKHYVKSEWYIHFINNPHVKVQFNSNLHVSEGHVMFQQMLTVGVKLN